MITLSKSIEYFQDDKYRDLPYGTIYYVAGTQTPYTDNLFRENIPVLIDQCNSQIRYVIPDDEWNKYYIIEAPKGREHKILLDRKFVSLPELS